MPARISKLAALSMLILVVSGAALTNSASDHSSRPALLTIHVAVAIAGILLTIALAIAGRETIAWCIAIALLIEAWPGYLLRTSAGPVAGTFHAVLSALLFAALAAMARVTSQTWQRDPDFVQDYGWPSLKFLSTAAAFLVAVQAGFGAGIRHSVVGVMPHLLGALVVALLIMIVGVFAMNQFPKHPALRPAAIGLMVVTGIQVFFGMTAFLMRLLNLTGSKVGFAITIAHVTTGSLTLAASVVFALEIRRHVRPREAKQ